MLLYHTLIYFYVYLLMSRDKKGDEKQMTIETVICMRCGVDCYVGEMLTMTKTSWSEEYHYCVHCVTGMRMAANMGDAQLSSIVRGAVFRKWQ